MSTTMRSAAGATAYSGAPRYAWLPQTDAADAADPATSAQVKLEWSSIIDELLSIRFLEYDWDGEGAEAPDHALVDWAIALAQRLQGEGIEPPGRVHASVNATVYFEWYTPYGYREIEVVSPTEAEWRIVADGANQAEVIYLVC